MAKLPDAEHWHGISPTTISPSGYPLAKMPEGTFIGRVGSCGSVYQEQLKR